MKKRSSRYPLGQFLIRLFEQSGLSLPEFAKTLGYSNVAKAIRAFDEVLDQGCSDIVFLDRLRAYASHPKELAQALEATMAILQAEGEKEAEMEELRERAAFLPYLMPDVENERGSPLTLFAITGGHTRNKIVFPKEMASYDQEHQFKLIKDAIRQDRSRNAGRTLFQGKITAYRYFDHFDTDPIFFNVEGDYIGEEIGDEAPDEPIIYLGKKKFGGGFY